MLITRVEKSIKRNWEFYNGWKQMRLSPSERSEDRRKNRAWLGLVEIDSRPEIVSAICTYYIRDNQSRSYRGSPRFVLNAIFMRDNVRDYFHDLICDPRYPTIIAAWSAITTAITTAIMNRSAISRDSEFIAVMIADPRNPTIITAAICVMLRDFLLNRGENRGCD